VTLAVTSVVRNLSKSHILQNIARVLSGNYGSVITGGNYG